MRSKNQEVDPLFAQFITKVFLIQKIFRKFRKKVHFYPPTNCQPLVTVTLRFVTACP